MRPEGNDRLARLFAKALVTRLPEGTASSALWATEAACRTRLGWNPHAEVRLWTQIRALCQKPPFSFQSHKEARDRFLDDRLAEANAGARKAGLGGSIQALESLVTQYPTDWQLAEQSARLLRQGRRWTNAIEAWKRVVEGAPDHVVAWHFWAKPRLKSEIAVVLSSPNHGPWRCDLILLRQPWLWVSCTASRVGSKNPSPSLTKV